MTPGILTGSEANRGPKLGFYLERMAFTPRNKERCISEHEWRAFLVRRPVAHCKALPASSHSLPGELQGPPLEQQQCISLPLYRTG